VPAEGCPAYGKGSAMNESLERHWTGSSYAACGGATPVGESIWKFRARSASLHFDHTVLAELIARRWKGDRRYLMSKIQG
jgi:hypothetical protein